MWVLNKVDEIRLLVYVSHIQGKQRPRLGKGHTYTPQETKSAEEEIALAFKEKHHDKYADFNGIVHVTVYVGRELQDSRANKYVGSQYIVKPDADNILKLVLDALNKVAYKDDNCITDSRIVKLPYYEKGSGNFLAIRLEYFEESYSKERNDK